MKMILIINNLVFIDILVLVLALLLFFFGFKSLVGGRAGNAGNAGNAGKTDNTGNAAVIIPTGSALRTTDDKQPIMAWQRLVSAALLTLKFLLLIFILGILYYSFKEEIDSNLKKNYEVYCFILFRCSFDMLNLLSLYLYSIFNFGTIFSSYTIPLFASDYEGDICTEADSLNSPGSAVRQGDSVLDGSGSASLPLANPSVPVLSTHSLCGSGREIEFGGRTNLEPGSPGRMTEGTYLLAKGAESSPTLSAPVVPADNSNSSGDTIPADNSNSTGNSSTSPAENSNSKGNSSASPAETLNPITKFDNYTSIEPSGSDTGASPDIDTFQVQEQRRVKFDDSVKVRTIFKTEPDDPYGPDREYKDEKPETLNTLSQEDVGFVPYRHKNSTNDVSNNTLPSNSSAVYEDDYYSEPVPVTSKSDNLNFEPEAAPVLKQRTYSEEERTNAGQHSPSNNSLAPGEAGPSVNANTANAAPEKSELNSENPDLVKQLLDTLLKYTQPNPEAGPSVNANTADAVSENPDLVKQLLDTLLKYTQPNPEAGPSVNANTANVAPEKSELNPVNPDPEESVMDKILKDAQYIRESQQLNKTENVILDNGFPEPDSSSTEIELLDQFGFPIDPETVYNTQNNKDDFSKHHTELKEEFAVKNKKLTAELASADLYSTSNPEPSNKPVDSTSNQTVPSTLSASANQVLGKETESEMAPVGQDQLPKSNAFFPIRSEAGLESVPAEQQTRQKRKLPLEFEESEQEENQRIDKKGKKKAD
jgi:hypothetical protein